VKDSIPRYLVLRGYALYAYVNGGGDVFTDEASSINEEKKEDSE
jgi:hypothetical protein